MKIIIQIIVYSLILCFLIIDLIKPIKLDTELRKQINRLVYGFLIIRLIIDILTLFSSLEN